MNDPIIKALISKLSAEIRILEIRIDKSSTDLLYDLLSLRDNLNEIIRMVKND